jgi:histidyl-tRNA synthetase
MLIGGNGMEKRLETMRFVGKEEGRWYDYMGRIFSSFAEIYNYDYTISPLWNEKEPFRQNGMLYRIQGYLEQHLNEEVIPQKMFYMEPVYLKQQEQEFGYLTIGKFDEMEMAISISLAVRILEAFGLRDLVVLIQVKPMQEEVLSHYLDCLDISYQKREVQVLNCDGVAFQILYQKEKNITPLIQGGNLSHLSHEFKELSLQAFGFWGSFSSIYDWLKEEKSQQLDPKMLDVVVTYETELEKEKALYYTQELRLNGFKTECIFRNQKNFIRENYNTRYVISLKESLFETNELIITDLETNEKETVKEMDLIDHLDLNI